MSLASCRKKKEMYTVKEAKGIQPKQEYTKETKFYAVRKIIIAA
jgi:hypothetical protein